VHSTTIPTGWYGVNSALESGRPPPGSTARCKDFRKEKFLLVGDAGKAMDEIVAQVAAYRP
jgi:hypothetical protein